MRRLVFLVVALLIALPTLPAHAAGVGAPRITRGALPQLANVARDSLYESLQGGELSEGQYALQRARSLFQLGAVRSRFGTVARPDPHSATFLMRDLALRLDSLSGDDRSEAESLLARPTQGASDPDGVGYSVPEATPICSANVCVHYVSRSSDSATTSFASQVSALMDDVWTTEISTFGWRAPVPDQSASPNGGNGRFDIYLADVGSQSIYGFCTPDPHQNTYAQYSYCVLDNDFAEFPPREASLRVTAAHEFNHAIQFAYDVTEDIWFMEATATWMEDEVYDDVDDNYQYLVTGPLGSPRVPADSFIGFNAPSADSGYQYGTFIWMRYLSETFGSRNVIRRIWEKVDATSSGDNMYSLQGIAAMLSEHGTDFPTSFADFAAKNAKAAAFYEEGSNYEEQVSPVRNIRRTLTQDTPSSTGSFTNVDHLSTRYVSFKPAGDVGPADQVTIAVNMDDTTTTQRATVVDLVGNVATYSPITLNSNGHGQVTVPFGGQDEVVLALSNASNRMSNCRGFGAFSCGGSPTDENQAYSFSAAIGTTAVDPGSPGGGGGGGAQILRNVSERPDPFHAGGGRTVKIRFSVLVDCITSVKIIKPNGVLLGILVPGQRTRAGAWVVTWSGTNTRGRLVPPGRYTYKIASTNTAGHTDRARGGIRVIR